MRYMYITIDVRFDGTCAMCIIIIIICTLHTLASLQVHRTSLPHTNNNNNNILMWRMLCRSIITHIITMFVNLIDYTIINHIIILFLASVTRLVATYALSFRITLYTGSLYNIVKNLNSKNVKTQFM